MATPALLLEQCPSCHMCFREARHVQLLEKKQNEILNTVI